jgi:uncharacterized iron-regulated membrane protein
MSRLRSLLFWLHLATGVMVAAVVLVMSVTGVLLTYQRQITAWADTRGLDASAPAPGQPRLGPEALLEAVRAREGSLPTAVTWRADADAPVQVAFGRERTLFVSAYTGETLGEGATTTRDFFRKVTDWHRWLAMSGDGRDTGKSITGAANLGFLFLVVSGLVLWFPRNLAARAFRNVLVFRRGLSPKARDFNWHNVIGFWSLAPLAVVVASAVVISYPWASDLVYRVAGEEPPAGRGPGGGGPPAAARQGGAPVAKGDAGRAPAAGAGGGGERRGEGGDAAEVPVSLAGMDALLARAERQTEGWRSVTLQVPEEGGKPVRFTIDHGDGGQPQHRAQLSLDPATAEVTDWEPFASNTPGRQARMILRFAHTGEVLGMVGQTIAGLVSLGAVVLVWTGIALSLRRFAAWRNRRSGVRSSGPRQTRRRREEEAVAG